MNLPSDFTITCHAGALGTKANTVDSVRTAVKWGAQRQNGRSSGYGDFNRNF